MDQLSLDQYHKSNFLKCIESLGSVKLYKSTGTTRADMVF